MFRLDHANGIYFIWKKRPALPFNLNTLLEAASAEKFRPLAARDFERSGQTNSR
jgi:hypothetical protein